MSRSKVILVIDDDRGFRGLLTAQLGDMGYDTTGAASWAEASACLKEIEPDLILLDMKLPDTTPELAVPELAAEYPVIVLTGYGSIRSAVSVIHAGALDYLTKPVSLAELELTIARVLDNAEMRRSNALYKRQLAARQGSGLIGNSAAILALESLIDAVAPTNATVLIHGESGSGKEVVASAIHQRSERKNSELVTVDATTLSETLFESELFGHEKGAFTGADRQKKGLIEAAEGGTLFLDEIGEVSLANQARLLRLFESGTFRRVGGTKTLRADVRFIVATHRNLGLMVREGRFRSDLFFRLSSFVLASPPLRDRREDIALLAEHFLSQFCRGQKKLFARDAITTLTAYDWPGNVRELRNVIERAVILARNAAVIRRDHVSMPELEGASVLSFNFEHPPTLKDLERSYFLRTLERFGGNRARTAAALGISERNVYRLIGLYGAELT